MKRKIVPLFFALSFIMVSSSNAQVKKSKDFIKELDEMQIDFLEPVENTYRKTNVEKSAIYKYDFAIKAKKKDMEIRFDLRPEYKNMMPHIQSISISSTVATNDEDALMALHEMSNQDLEKYNADWGASFFFQPKKMFSSKKHGKMIALFKEDRGMVIIFYLFNEPSEEVDLQKYCLSFLEKEDVE